MGHFDKGFGSDTNMVYGVHLHAGEAMTGLMLQPSIMLRRTWIALVCHCLDHHERQVVLRLFRWSMGCYYLVGSSQSVAAHGLPATSNPPGTYADQSVAVLDPVVNLAPEDLPSPKSQLVMPAADLVTMWVLGPVHCADN